MLGLPDDDSGGGGDDGGGGCGAGDNVVTMMVVVVMAVVLMVMTKSHIWPLLTKRGRVELIHGGTGSILKHLDTPATYAWTLLLQYSSIFNTIRPMTLTVQLANLGTPTPTRNWILDFLKERPQVVRMGNNMSAEITVSTRTLQGCCLSP